MMQSDRVEKAANHARVSIDEVMSSTRLLINFGVICCSSTELAIASSHTPSMTYSRGTAIEIVQVLVERVAIQLDSDDLFCGGVGDAKCFLQTFQHALAVLERVLIANTSIPRGCRLWCVYILPSRPRPPPWSRPSPLPSGLPQALLPAEFPATIDGSRGSLHSPDEAS